VKTWRLAKLIEEGLAIAIPSQSLGRGAASLDGRAAAGVIAGAPAFGKGPG